MGRDGVLIVAGNWIKFLGPSDPNIFRMVSLDVNTTNDPSAGLQCMHRYPYDNDNGSLDDDGDVEFVVDVRKSPNNQKG